MREAREKNMLQSRKEWSIESPTGRGVVRESVQIVKPLYKRKKELRREMKARQARIKEISGDGACSRIQEASK